ncbi:MAG: hypothetical protein SGARI_006651 [Bacillariaceae sp.]
MPNLIDYMRTHLSAWENSGRDNTGLFDMTHMSLWMYLQWSRVFDDTQLLDLHYPGDFFTEFVCQALPGANETCGYLQQKYANEHQNTTNNKTGGSNVHRVSSNHFGVRVVDAAFEQGMISSTTTKYQNRRDFWKKSERVLQSMNLEEDPEYRWCPSDVLENRIRNASVTFLEVLHSKPANDQLYHHQNWTLALQEHDELFWKAKRKHKFCDINTTRVLRNAEFVRKVFGKSGTAVLKSMGVIDSEEIGDAPVVATNKS